MDQSILLREATAADIPTLLRLIHTAFAEYEGQLDPPSGAHAETLESLSNALHFGSAALASVDGEIGGCVFYSPKDGHVYIGRLAVLPAFRRFGVGKSLMRYAEQRAGELGFRRVQIGVRLALPHLHAYYENLGYVRVRDETHPGYKKPTYTVMEKGNLLTVKTHLNYPQRVVCLTEETTETLYLLGEQDRIVGVSGYTARPPEARSKPKVSAFISAKYDKIESLKPDLVLAFSDLQADIARDLAKRGFNVIVFNQRSVSEILQMVLTLARIVGAEAKGIALVENFESSLAAIGASARRLPRRPRVLFEEWDDPLISGIRWVEELIEIAGGEPIFPELRDNAVAPDRVVRPDDVLRREPEIIIGSWCGKKVRKDFIRSRPGWSELPAVRNQHIYEIKSTYILQPGPAAVTEGVRQLHAIIAASVGMTVDPALLPVERLDPDLKLRVTQ
jgi:iron complex transport system substrate-binding protein